MYSRPALQDAPAAARCEVFAAAALRVRIGVNAGDDLASPDQPIAGDIYRLQDDARPAWLRLTAPGPDGLRRIGLGSDVGGGGDAVTVRSRLLFMAADGVRTEVLVLEPCLQRRTDTGALLVPLQPLIAGIDLTLIRIEAAPGPCRLPDLVCGAIGRGSRITLAGGAPRRAEALCPGDMVLTRDHGAQPLRWAGRVTMRATGAHAPVAIARGALGNADELRLGQHSRLLLYNRSTASGRAQAETLVQARHLLGTPGIQLREGGFVDYVMLVFDRHEVIYAEGIATESLLVNAATLQRLPEALTTEVQARFPGLNQDQHFGTEASRAGAAGPDCAPSGPTMAPLQAPSP